MRALAVIAQVVGNLFPGGAVPGSGTSNRVGDFVQQDLVHFVVLILSRQMPGDRDALVCEITKTCSRASMVKSKAPDSRIQVQADEGIRPLRHTF
jgi:hypothetical protein